MGFAMRYIGGLLLFAALIVATDGLTFVLLTR